jgi:hypothetical protein
MRSVYRTGVVNRGSVFRMRHVYVDLPGIGDSLGAPRRMLSPAGARLETMDAAIIPV